MVDDTHLPRLQFFFFLNCIRMRLLSVDMKEISRRKYKQKKNYHFCDKRQSIQTFSYYMRLLP